MGEAQKKALEKANPTIVLTYSSNLDQSGLEGGTRRNEVGGLGRTPQKKKRCHFRIKKSLGVSENTQLLVISAWTKRGNSSS